jgi:hypothetical protein
MGFPGRAHKLNRKTRRFKTAGEGSAAANPEWILRDDEANVLFVRCPADFLSGSGIEFRSPERMGGGGHGHLFSNL